MQEVKRAIISFLSLAGVLVATASDVGAQITNLSGLDEVAAAAMPTQGSFLTVQRPAPLPFNPRPDLPLYSLGNGKYLVDDRTVDYVALQQQAEEANAVQFERPVAGNHGSELDQWHRFNRLARHARGPRV
jgi:hypothetical protein